MVRLYFILLVKIEDGSSRKDLWSPPEGTAPLPAEDNAIIKFLMDVSETQESVVEDHFLLTNTINFAYMLQLVSEIIEVMGQAKPRFVDKSFGSVENPSKPLRCNPAIVKDKNKCYRLVLEMNRPMLVKHSKYHTQGWRANRDIPLILPRSNPDPSVDEIMAA